MGLFDGGGWDDRTAMILASMAERAAQSAMPSRMPIPTGAVFGNMAGGISAGEKDFHAIDKSKREGKLYDAAALELQRKTQAQKAFLERMNRFRGGEAGPAPQIPMPAGGGTMGALAPAADMLEPRGAPAKSGGAPSAEGNLGFPALRSLAEQVGFKGDAATKIAAISLAESSGNPNAIGDRDLGGSYGLTQIHEPAHGPKAREALGNPRRAMELALDVSKGGTDFSPWTTFKNGTYEKHLPKAGGTFGSLSTGGPGNLPPPRPSGWMDDPIDRGLIGDTVGKQANAEFRQDLAALGDAGGNFGSLAPRRPTQMAQVAPGAPIGGMTLDDAMDMRIMGELAGMGDAGKAIWDRYQADPRYKAQLEEALIPGRLREHGGKKEIDIGAAYRMPDANVELQGQLSGAKAAATLPVEKDKITHQTTQQIRQAEGTPTGDIKEYQFYRQQTEAAGGQPLGFQEWDISRRRSSATMVNTAPGLEAAQVQGRIDIDKTAAADVTKQANSARRVMPLIDEVARLAHQTPGGWAGPAAATTAKALSALGFPVPEGASNAELLQSISQQLVPIVREPGATAAIEMDTYLRAVPGLLQSPDGRMKVADMTKRLAQRTIEISRVYRENLGKPELYDRLAELDKPVFTDDQRAAMQAVGAAPPSSGNQPVAAAPLPPPIGTIEDGYRFLGGDPTDRTSWERAN